MIVRELLARLGFNVDTKNVDSWEKRVKVAKATMKEATEASKELAKFTLKVSTAMAAAGGAIVAMVTRTAAKFETLNASLRTVTGSSAAAAEAFAMIRKLAADTPFSVEQLTQSFIKLKALGLDASKEALTSYGNTAAAMGKGLDQMIEAVADAATGEFERLKEFGIKASSEGDRVTFTFQGISTTVGKNAKEIEGYLRGIGDNNFAGAMSDQMDTFNGIVSNIKDNLDAFLMQVGKEGLLQAMKEVGKEIRDMTGGGSNLARTLGRTLAMAVKSVWGLIRDGLPILMSLVQAFTGLLDLFGGPAGLIVALTAGKAAMMSFSLGMQAMNATSALASSALRGVGLAAGAMAIALAGAALIVAKTEKEIAKLKAHDADVDAERRAANERFAAEIGGDSRLAEEINKERKEVERLRLRKANSEQFGSAFTEMDAKQLALAEERLESLTAEDARRFEESPGAAREQARLQRAEEAKDRARFRDSPSGRFLRKAKERGARVGATDEAVEAARAEFEKLRGKGFSTAVAEQRALKKLRGMSSTGGGRRKAKKDGAQKAGDELSVDEMLERDFGAGLGSPIKGVRPSLGTTINKIDNSYSPQVQVTIEVTQQPGEDAGSLASRTRDLVRDMLDSEIRRGVDHFMGAVTG